jgi:penicillin-binding protein 2
VDERLRDHALFMAYAPADDPQIAVALIVENGGWGASVAAPIARKVFDYWLAPARVAERQQKQQAEEAALTQVTKASGRPETAPAPDDEETPEPAPLPDGSDEPADGTQEDIQ